LPTKIKVMSDSIKKWHEMQEDKLETSNDVKKFINDLTDANSKIYESPDGGKTVTERPFGGDISDRKTIIHPQTDLKKQAYKLLVEYDEEVIRMANKILDIGE